MPWRGVPRPAPSTVRRQWRPGGLGPPKGDRIRGRGALQGGKGSGALPLYTGLLLALCGPMLLPDCVLRPAEVNQTGRSGGGVLRMALPCSFPCSCFACGSLRLQSAPIAEPQEASPRAIDAKEWRGPMGSPTFRDPEGTVRKLTVRCRPCCRVE